MDSVPTELLVVFMGAAIVFAMRIEGWKGRVDEMLREINRKLDRNRRSPPVIEQGSRLRLTELGEAVSAELGAGALADVLVPHLLHRVKGKSEYEIHEFCMDYAQRRNVKFSPHTRFWAEQVAFNNGLALEDVLEVLAIVLRDMLLEKAELPEAPEWTPLSVDPT